MKHIHITLEDSEHEKLEQVKQEEDLTWKELLLEKIKNAGD